MRAGRTEEHGSPASSLLTMRYNINLFFVACTAREHTFTRYKVYMRGGSALFFSVVCTAVHTLYGVAVHSRHVQLVSMYVIRFIREVAVHFFLLSVVCTAIHTLYGVAVHSRRDVDRAVTSGTRG